MAGVLMAAGAASGEQPARSVAECDAGLELLRQLTQSGTLEERELAWLSIDVVLDRRNELTSRKGADDE